MRAQVADKSDTDDEDAAPSFPDVQAAVEAAIADFGAVLPKLNWSSPKDAEWMNVGGLKCTSYNDVCVLLQASDFIVHDLLHAYDDCDAEEPRTPASVFLCLRRWHSLNPAMEFR